MNWRALVRSFDITAYLKGKDPSLKKSLPNVYIRCPVCEKDEKMWVVVMDFKRPNKETGEPELVRAGSWICYYCGKGQRDDLIGLIERMEDCERFEALEILYAEVHKKKGVEETSLRDVVNDALFGVADDEELEMSQPVELQRMELPEEYWPITLDNEMPPYFAERGISRARAVKHRLGYCASGKYKNRLIVPVYDEAGEQVFFVARYMQAKPPLRKCLACYGLGKWQGVQCAKCKGKGKVALKKTLYPIGARPKQVLYGLADAANASRVICVEDVFSRMHLGAGCVALFGTEMSPAQLQLLIKNTSATELVLLLDRDATVRHVPRERDCEKRRAGKVCADCSRYEKTWRLAHRLSELWRVKVPQLPDARDPDEHTRASIEALIEATPAVRPADGLRRAVAERL